MVLRMKTLESLIQSRAEAQPKKRLGPSLKRYRFEKVLPRQVPASLEKLKQYVDRTMLNGIAKTHTPHTHKALTPAIKGGGAVRQAVGRRG